MVDYLLNTEGTYNWGTGVIINTGHVNSSPILMAVDRDTCNTCGAERGTMPDVNITGASKLFSARKFVTVHIEIPHTICNRERSSWSDFSTQLRLTCHRSNNHYAEFHLHLRVQ